MDWRITAEQIIIHADGDNHNGKIGNFNHKRSAAQCTT